MTDLLNFKNLVNLFDQMKSLRTLICKVNMKNLGKVLRGEVMNLASQNHCLLNGGLLFLKNKS